MSIALLYPGQGAAGGRAWRRRGRPDIVLASSALARRLAAPAGSYLPGDRTDLVGALRPTEPGYYRSDFTPYGCAWSGGGVGLGDLVVNVSGVEVTGVRVPNGRIRGNSAVTGVHVWDNVVHGGPTPGGSNTTPYPLINSSFNGGTGWLVEDNTLIWDTAKRTVDSYGVHLQAGTARRNHVAGAVDGFVIYGPDCTLEANLVDDLQFYANDPRQTDGSHTDGIQDEGGARHRIVGNDIVAMSGQGTSSLLLSQNHARYDGLLVAHNRFRGGKALAVIGTEKGRGAFLDFTYRDNAHGRESTEGQRGVGVAIFPAATYDAMTQARNTFTDGTSMTLRRG